MSRLEVYQLPEGLGSVHSQLLWGKGKVFFFPFSFFFCDRL